MPKKIEYTYIYEVECIVSHVEYNFYIKPIKCKLNKKYRRYENLTDYFYLAKMNNPILLIKTLDLIKMKGYCTEGNIETCKIFLKDKMYDIIYNFGNNVDLLYKSFRQKNIRTIYRSKI